MSLKNDEKERTFENAMDRLQEIVSLLETGKADLDDELKLYEEGVALIRYCSDKLNQAEQKIREITAEEKSGEVIDADA